jgi:hypothetical protein
LRRQKENLGNLELIRAKCESAFPVLVLYDLLRVETSVCHVGLARHPSARVYAKEKLQVTGCRFSRTPGGVHVE